MESERIFGLVGAVRFIILDVPSFGIIKAYKPILRIHIVQDFYRYQ